MLKNIIMTLVAAGAVSCAQQPSFDPTSTKDVTDEISHVEPLSWWVGMKTPLQIMVNGEGISEYEITVKGPVSDNGECPKSSGVSIKKVHRADSPNYLFVDLDIRLSATPGTYYLIFSKDGESFK